MMQGQKAVLSMTIVKVLLAFLPILVSSAPLPQYNINVKGPSSISGLSSGAYFAVQMQVAYSSYFQGACIFAGGPYDCAGGSETTAITSCMTGSPAPNVNKCVNTTNTRAKSNLLDISNLPKHLVYMYSGTQDTTVDPSVMNALQTYYTSFIAKSQIQFANDIKSAHTQPTDDPVNTEPCTLSVSPYISDCDYDGAGECLTHVYSGLKPRNDDKLTGSVIEFDQSQFYSSPNSISLASTGYAYVPAACANGSSCRLHVSLHGCLQYAATVGTKYVTNTGYNKWADTNNIVVLYPQTNSSATLGNPNGCWDWWGYNKNSASNYDTNQGVQMQTIAAMIDWIGGKYNPIDPPTGLKAGTITDNSISLTWDSDATAAGYNVYRNGAKVTSAMIKTSTYQDTGLSSGTSYSYTVTALTGDGGESQQSSPLQVTTTGPPPPLQPPTGLTMTNATSSTLAYKWDAVSGATGYNFYRNGVKVNTAVITTTTYTDSNLAASTTYSDSVSSVNASSESAQSTAVAGTTKSAWTCQDFYDNNYNQVNAGRAYEKNGYCFAVGSDDPMGLWNVATYTNLEETAAGYYEVGYCS